MSDQDDHDALKQAGVPVGGWTRKPVGGGRKPLPPILHTQRESLLQLRALLQLQLEQDRMTVAELHEKLARLKQGGGK